MKLTMQFDREMDDRGLPRCRSCRASWSTTTALAKVLSLAYTVFADEAQHGERDGQSLLSVTFDTCEAV
jgi:hypothetical protein